MEGMVIGIVFLVASSIIASQMALDWRLDHRLRLFSVLLFVSVVVFYIRRGFDRYFTTIDESYYVSLLGNSRWYLSSIVSGYVTPFSLHLLKPFFNSPVDEVEWYSITMSLVYVLVLFFSYRRLGLSPRRSVSAVFVLFMTPLYIWSVIQVRPQQIGLLLGFITVMVLLSEVRRKIKMFFILSLYILLVFSHVLSFILYSVLLVLYLSVRVFVFDDSEALKTYRLLAFALIVSWTTFLLFPYSHPVLRNITWLFNSVTGLRLSVSIFSAFSLVFLFVILVLWYLLFLKFHGKLFSFAYLLYRILIRILEEIERKRVSLFGVVSLSMVFGIIYIQFHLGSSVYNWIYRGSPLSLLVFQTGNIAFALLYLRGILLAIRRSTFGPFELLSLVMLPIALLFLGVSFLMPNGNGIWGFHNWLIRALQYFVPIAAPVVLNAIEFDVLSTNRAPLKFFFSLLMGLLITISILNTARIPAVYNYDAVWSPELVSLCSKGGVYVPRVKISQYSYFVEDNLLRACGGTLKSKLESNIGILMASDSFYRYWSVVSSLSIGGFSNILLRKYQRPLILAGGSSQIDLYIAALFPKSSLVLLSNNHRCSLSGFVLGRPVVLIGGPMVNPCVRILDEEGILKFSITSNSVRTPHLYYHVPVPKPWWNRKEGIFVVSSITYDGIPLLIVAGTDRDSTLAGVYYFVNEILTNPNEYVNVSYIVGLWKETDGMVIDVAKGSPRDSNGFSPSDKIEIIEKG